MRRSLRLSMVGDVSEHEVDNLVDIELVSVDDDRVRRRAKRSNGAIRVDAIPLLDLCAHGLLVDVLATPLVLGRSAPNLFFEAGGQEELVVDVREYDGADVPAGH